MKNIILFLSVSLVFLLIFNCTEDFKSINTNTVNISDDVLEQDFNHIKAEFPNLFSNIYQITPLLEWGYQIQTGLQGDVWSGYMATPTPFSGNSNNTHYNLKDGWNSYSWDLFYGEVMPAVTNIKYKAENDYKEFYAISLILKATAIHKMVNKYGPLLVTNFDSETLLKPFDSEQEIHELLFKDLDTAITILESFALAENTSSIITIDESLYNGDYIKWIKYANSIRLRIAMRMVKADPVRAELEAVKSLTQPFGLIFDNTDNFIVKIPNATHPINKISNSWNDIRMGADIESIMVGYNDPRLNVYFEPALNFGTIYKGVRTGINIISKTDRINTSKIGQIVQQPHITFFTAAETHFLIAEAALRGWDTQGISARSAYEKAILMSFNQYGITGQESYIENDINLPVAFKDPLDEKNNEQPLNSVTIKWNELDSKEKKLQKIITQKWIAMFPDGHEAWSEWRRTGYPKLFKIEVNKSGGTIPTDLGVRRYPYPLSEYDTALEAITQAVKLLSGEDTGATRLWWDRDVSNF